MNISVPCPPRLPKFRWPSALICTLLLAAACVAVAQPIPAGKSQLTATLDGTPVQVYTYRPTNYTSGPLFLVFHGMLRNADAYRDSAVVLGDTFGALIAAPEFDTNHFPSETYQRGGVFRKDKLQPKEKWTYSLIPKLVEELRRREGHPDLPYYYIGHSAGGQFLVRMTAFLPTEVQRIVAVNAGAHIFPTHDLPFPYGFGGLPPELGDDNAIKRFLAQPLTLYQGTADVLEKDLDMKPDAMKQGPTRIERGRANFRLAQKRPPRRAGRSTGASSKRPASATIPKRCSAIRTARKRCSVPSPRRRRDRKM